MSEILYGKRPILEALEAGKRRISKLFFSTSEQEPETRSLLRLCQERQVKTQAVSRKWLEEKLPEALTQGWAAEVSDYPYADFEALLQSLGSRSEATVLVLDQLQDPQNVGAILRSAECSGVDGVLLPADRSASISPSVCKAAAGAEEHLPIAQVTNLARAIAALKKRGFWVVGTLFPEAGLKVEDSFDFAWPEKTVLVLGSEGKGMRRLTREGCDFLIHLPTLGKISSLNVSAAAAIFLYQILKSRKNSKE